MQHHFPNPSSQLGAALPFAIVGSLSIVTGGLIAAATAHNPSQHGTWAIAYLVLVVGVAQVALGGGQALLTPARPSRRVLITELVAFNAGNVCVLVGTLLDTTWLVDIGGALLAGALILFLRGETVGRGRVFLAVYRLLIAIVLVSIPIGLVLARS